MLNDDQKAEFGREPTARKPAPDPLTAALLDICRPDGPHARLAVLLGSIENARTRILQADRIGLESSRIAGIALEEIRKIYVAKEAYDRVKLGET